MRLARHPGLLARFLARFRNDCAPGFSNDLEFFSLSDANQMVQARYDNIKLVGMVDRGDTDP